MTQTLLVEENEKLASLYSLNLQIYVGTDVIWKKTAADAIKVLEVIPQLSLIISRNSIEQEQTAVEVSEYIQNNNLSIPFITLGEDEKLKKTTVVLPEQVEIKALIRQAAKMLAVTPKKMVEKIIPDFYPIPIKHFLYVNTAVNDLYIKLSKSPDDFHFVKRIPASEIFSRGLIERYMNKGLEFLYVLKNDRILFIKSFTEQLLEKLADENLTITERIEATEVVFELVANLFRSEGYSEENMRVANAGLKSVMTITSQAEGRIQQLLENLLELKTSYLFKHVIVTNFLGIHALTKMSWKREEHFSQFTFACFFHDILLDTEKQAKIKTRYELNQLEDKDEHKCVDEHALMAGKLVTDIPDVPVEVVNIIIQHHGQHNGIGFVQRLEPKHVRNDLSEFSYVFMASEAYADVLLDPEMKRRDFNAVIDELPEFFDHKKFKRTLECFSDMKD